MNSKVKIKKRLVDTFWNTLGSGLFALVSVILLMGVTRKFGIVIAGSFGISLTTSQLLYRIGLFAVRQYQITDIESEFSFETYFSAKIISTSLAFLGCGLYSVFTPVIRSDRMQFLLVFLFYQLLSIDDVYQNHFFQEGRLDKSGKSKCLILGSYLISFLFFLCIGLELNLILFLSLCIGILMSYIVCFRKIHIINTLWEAPASLVLKTCFPAFISNFLLALTNSIPKYCVYYFCGDEKSGYYNSIFVVLNVIELISSFIYYPYIPDITNYVKNDCGEARKSILKIIFIIFVTDIVISIGFGCFGNKVLKIIYGVDFSDYLLEILYNIGVCGMCIALISLLYWIPVILKIKWLLIAIFMAGTMIAAVFCVIGAQVLGIYGAIIGHSIALGTIVLLLVILFIKRTSPEVKTERRKIWQ